ncbi:MAG: hypothetical protein GY854_14935 [Deltaproteobacteria bacterium]|nr:hypothetical protein [Deltaproteobacteria bacterium]
MTQSTLPAVSTLGDVQDSDTDTATGTRKPPSHATKIRVSGQQRNSLTDIYGATAEFGREAENERSPSVNSISAESHGRVLCPLASPKQFASPMSEESVYVDLCDVQGEAIFHEAFSLRIPVVFSPS